MAFRKVATAGGGGAVCLGKDLPRGGTSSVVIWGRDLGADGSNVIKALEGTCGLPTAGDG